MQQQQQDNKPQQQQNNKQQQQQQQEAQPDTCLEQHTVTAMALPIVGSSDHCGLSGVLRGLGAVCHRQWRIWV